MVGLPQLIEEDIQALDAALVDFLGKSEATVGLITDRAGFLITKQGRPEELDLVTLSALAANAFAATQAIADLVQETAFNCLYQQGERWSLVVQSIDENCLLIVVFPADRSVGAVKYYALGLVSGVAGQMKTAYSRQPGVSLDLSSMNLADPSRLFRKNPN